MSRPTHQSRGRTAVGVGASASLLTGAGSALLLALTASPAGAVATTYTVDTLADGPGVATDCTTPVAGSCSLRDALAAVSAGDTIEFDMALFAGGPQTLTMVGTGVYDFQVSVGITISGPGADLLTIDAHGTSRVFDLNSAPTSLTTISGMTITGGGNTGGSGGGINGAGEVAIHLDSVVVTGNQVTQASGGGVSARGPIVIRDSSITNNTSPNGGGGLYLGRDATIINSTVGGNHSGNCGGGLYFGQSNGNLTIVNSTFVDNETAHCYGGAIDIDGNDNAVYISNSTFTGNSSFGTGGAISSDYGNTIVIAQTTITGNSALQTISPYYGGGGIHLVDRVTLVLSGSVVSGNSSTSGPADIGSGNTHRSYNQTMTANNSFLGTLAPSLTVQGSGNLTGSDPQLGALAFNGGPTRTMVPLPGSPLIDAGPNPVAQFLYNNFDQRGQGFLRVVGSVSDIGAVERQAAPQGDGSGAPTTTSLASATLTPTFTG